MNHTNTTRTKLPPIQAPITPERAAAIQTLKHSGLLKSYSKSISALRDDFESWTVTHFHCPQGRGSLALNQRGEYSKTVYDFNDKSKFVAVEHLWQAYLAGNANIK